MAEVDADMEQYLDYQALSPSQVDGYVKLFKEGKAIVPINKVMGALNYGKRDARGEAKKVNSHELWNYWLADGTVQQGFGVKADLTIAYGFTFDLPKPMRQQLDENDMAFLDRCDLWRHYVKLDTKMKNSVIGLFIFGDYFAEKVYDRAPLSDESWGIKAIKVLDPRTMYVDRAPDGRIKMYYQHPKASQMQPRSIMRSNKSIAIPPPQMVHIKLDDIINQTYGNSKMYSILDTIDMKLGLKNDAVAIAQRRASPFLVWSIGSDDKIYPPTLISEIRSDLEGQLFDTTDSDVFVPGFIKVEAIAGDNSAGENLLPLIDFMNKEIANASGIPDIVLAGGGGSSGESAMIKNEILTRQVKSLQITIGDEWRNQVYVDLLFPPTKSKTGVVKGKELTPAMYRKVPYNKWGTIESVADNRLRMESLSNSAFLGEEEGRNQLGFRGKLEDEAHTVPNRVKLKDADTKEKQANKPDTPIGGQGTPTKKPKKAKAIDKK